MSDVSAQYEAYPYPERDPRDELKRLITGSPSHPLEIDHFVFGGKRDWRKPLRALVAGGGTGDGLIQLAQILKSAGRPFEITYLDMSRSARAVAEERAALRELEGIEFVTGSLLSAPDLGRFDYIDCCGVLHHLGDPQAGFDALARALTPAGGLGFMVYAPYGRSGVYPLQEAFGELLAGFSPQEKLARAREVFARLPAGHPFRCNPHLNDHNVSDAGFYDLLLHAQDRPFAVGDLWDSLTAAGLELSSFTQPALYDPAEFLGEMEGPHNERARMELAEKLRGTIRMHVGYAVGQGRGARAVAGGPDAALVPHLKGVGARALADQLARKGQLRLTLGAGKITLKLPRAAAPLVALIDGRRTLAQIAREAGLDGLAFNALWTPTGRALSGYGLLLYSRLLV